MAKIGEARDELLSLNDSDKILADDGSGNKKIRKDNLQETLGIDNLNALVAAINAARGAADGIATLDSAGKVLASQIPSLALVDVFTVASESAMLALDAQQGDMAIRTDESMIYILGSSPASTLENWIELSAIETLIHEYFNDLAGDGRNTETVKGNADDIDALEVEVDNNKLYARTELQALGDKYKALVAKTNTYLAEIYTDSPILSYAEITPIGEGFESDDTPVDIKSSVVDGSTDMTLKGMLLTNLVENGKMNVDTNADGVADGWTKSASEPTCTVSYEGQKLAVDATMGAADRGVEQYSQNAKAGDILQVFFKYKYVETRNTASRVRIYFYDSSDSVISNEVTDLLLESTDFIAGSLRVTCPVNTSYVKFVPYIRSGVSFDSVGEITYTDFAPYNLTDLGLDSITDTGILADLLPHVEGTKNVGELGVMVTGVNKFDKNKGMMDMVLSTASFVGSEPVYSADDTVYIAPPIRVSEGQVLSRGGGSFNNLRTRFVFVDKNNIILSDLSQSETLLTVPSNAYYLIACCDKNFLDSHIINLGSTALPYEPYKEQLTFFPALGNRLPNGVADTIEKTVDGYDKVQRTKRYVLTEDDIIRIEDQWANLDGAIIQLPSNSEDESLARKYSLDGFDFTGYPVDVASNGGRVDVYSSALRHIVVYYEKSSTSLSEAKTALSGKVIRYQLETPITTHLDIPHISCWENGTIERFPGTEQIAFYGSGLTFSKDVLSVISATKFSGGVATDITDDAVISGTGVTFSGVNADDVVHVKVRYDVDEPIGTLEYVPPVENTKSRLISLEDRVTALETV